MGIVSPPPWRRDTDRGLLSHFKAITARGLDSVLKKKVRPQGAFVSSPPCVWPFQGKKRRWSSSFFLFPLRQWCRSLREEVGPLQPRSSNDDEGGSFLLSLSGRGTKWSSCGITTDLLMVSNSFFTRSSLIECPGGHVLLHCVHHTISIVRLSKCYTSVYKLWMELKCLSSIYSIRCWFAFPMRT